MSDLEIFLNFPSVSLASLDFLGTLQFAGSLGFCFPPSPPHLRNSNYWLCVLCLVKENEIPRNWGLCFWTWLGFYVMDNIKFSKFPWALLGFQFRVNSSILRGPAFFLRLSFLQIWAVSSLIFPPHSSLSWDHDIHKWPEKLKYSESNYYECLMRDTQSERTIRLLRY